MKRILLALALSCGLAVPANATWPHTTTTTTIPKCTLQCPVPPAPIVNVPQPKCPTPVCPTPVCPAALCPPDTNNLTCPVPVCPAPIVNSSCSPVSCPAPVVSTSCPTPVCDCPTGSPDGATVCAPCATDESIKELVKWLRFKKCRVTRKGVKCQGRVYLQGYIS